MQQLPKKVLNALLKRDVHYTKPSEFKKILIQSTLLPIALSLFLSVLFIQQVYSVLDENQKVRTSDEVLNMAIESLKLVLDSETSFRGYVITTNDDYLTPWVKARNRFNEVSGELLKLLEEDSLQFKQVQKIRYLYTSWDKKASDALIYTEKYHRNTPLEIQKERKKIMDTLRISFDEFILTERSIRNNRWKDAEETSKNAVYIIISLGIFLGCSLAMMTLIQLKKLSSTYKTAYSSLAAATDHLEEQVAQRTHELTMSNKELEAFSYSVSHDLRSPLRGIDGFSQILIEDYTDKLDAQGIKYLGFIRSGVQKMGVLIDDLINLSRLARSEFILKEVNLSVIAAEIINELRAEDPERKCEFINLEPHIVMADAGLIRAALQNLISNAWKYSNTKEDSQIEFGMTSENGSAIYFVKDNGVGFDMRFYDKLFQPFQRLHSKDQFEGSGIGLATVARIIRKHDGLIWAESSVGHGSVFYFTLKS